MGTYLVTLDTGQNLGGMFRMMEQKTVTADTAAEARVAAREPGKRVSQVEQVFTWHVTLRGRDDKRRRETFVMSGTSEARAIQSLSYNPAVYRFAGSIIGRKARERAIVKIERRTT